MKYLIIFLGALGLGLLFFLGMEYIEIIRFNGFFTLLYIFDWITRYILPWIILYFLIKIARK